MSMNKRGTVPVRDETGKFTGVRPKTAAERVQVGSLPVSLPFQYSVVLVACITATFFGRFLACAVN